MNILYITPLDPRDVSNGSAQRTHYLWSALKELGSVYSVVWRSGGTESRDEEDDSIAYASLFPSGIKARLQSLFYTHWFKPSFWWFHRGLGKVMPWQGIKFDVVVARYLHSVVISRAWKVAPVFVDVDDLPTEVFDTIYAKSYVRWWRPLARRVLAAWQRHFLGKCKGAWIANGNQVGVIERSVKCCHLANLAIPPKPGYALLGRQKRQLMTVGLMDYAPNYTGVTWFLKNVWPEVHAAMPDMVYVICGRRMRASDKESWSHEPGVVVLGCVEDLDLVYSESMAVVAPILAGSGTCIKVVESALHGRTTFATEFAVRGLSQTEKAGLGILPLTAREIIKKVSGFDPNLQNDIAAFAQKCNSYGKFAKSVADLIKGDGKQ